jgi:hypothetical protein
VAHLIAANRGVTAGRDKSKVDDTARRVSAGALPATVLARLSSR